MGIVVEVVGWGILLVWRMVVEVLLLLEVGGMVGFDGSLLLLLVL